MNNEEFERVLKCFGFEKIESTSKSSMPFYLFHNIAIYYDNGAIFKGKVPLEVLDKFADEEGVKVESPLTKIDNYLSILSINDDKLEEKLVKLRDIVTEGIAETHENNRILEVQITNKLDFRDFLLEIERYYSEKQGLDYDAQKKLEEKIKKNILHDALKEAFGRISKEDWIRNYGSSIREKYNNLQEKLASSSLGQRLKEAIDNFDKACNPFFDEKMKSIADFPTKIKLEYRPAYIDIAYDRNESCFFGITVDDVQDKGYIGYCRNDDFLKCGSSFKKMEMETFSVSHEFSIDLEYCN